MQYIFDNTEMIEGQKQERKGKGKSWATFPHTAMHCRITALHKIQRQSKENLNGQAALGGLLVCSNFALTKSLWADIDNLTSVSIASNTLYEMFNDDLVGKIVFISRSL